MMIKELAEEVVPGHLTPEQLQRLAEIVESANPTRDVLGLPLPCHVDALIWHAFKEAVAQLTGPIATIGGEPPAVWRRICIQRAVLTVAYSIATHRGVPPSSLTPERLRRLISTMWMHDIDRVMTSGRLEQAYRGRQFRRKEELRARMEAAYNRGRFTCPAPTTRGAG